MTTKTQIQIIDKNLLQSVADVYSDAIMYFEFRAEDAGRNHEKMLAKIAVKEFATGRDMLDMLIDEDGDTFLVPEAAETVTKSLLNFQAALDGKEFPLLWWRVTDAVLRSQTAPCLCESEDDLCPKQTLH
ncbi:hypothetical protein [Methylobacterium durans]|uniref:Uncharacterized protein n=1 Tax=Methylobacterium durans TaxID=2202825 RepID=A0A2U8W3N9_9HYPH|nr:hypothetical protein [Methylobacterium durans]AWN40704.1 hypothetical protein DK389_09410 [Methylobacterium durans]